jgi:beta-lactamase superfamily II metal-dependent hydrolase
MSYVVRIRHGINVIYLCGDATDEKTFPDLIQHYGEDFFEKREGEITILKAAHHGRSSGYNKDFVSLISPDAVIVSVGKKPSTDASNKYRQYSDNVWSTRYKGNIQIRCDSNNYYYSFEHDR